MCHISYQREYNKDEFIESLKLHIDRGTDSFWYIWKDIIDKKDTKDATEATFPDIASKTIKIPEGWWICAHARKTSIGNKNVENAHPYNISDIVFMQNGTDKTINPWAKIMFLDQYDQTKSDSYYLTQYILIRRSMWFSLHDTLQHLVASDICLWSIFLYDRSNNILYFASDGSRESYIDYRQENKKVIIDEISTYWYNINKDKTKYDKSKYNNVTVLTINPDTGELLNKDEIELTSLNTQTWPIFNKPVVTVVNDNRTTRWSIIISKSAFVEAMRLLTNELLNKNDLNKLYDNYDSEVVLSATRMLLTIISNQDDGDIKKYYVACLADGELFEQYIRINLMCKSLTEIEEELLKHIIT